MKVEKILKGHDIYPNGSMYKGYYEILNVVNKLVPKKTIIYCICLGSNEKQFILLLCLLALIEPDVMFIFDSFLQKSFDDELRVKFKHIKITGGVMVDIPRKFQVPIFVYAPFCPINVYTALLMCNGLAIENKSFYFLGNNVEDFYWNNKVPEYKNRMKELKKYVDTKTNKVQPLDNLHQWQRDYLIAAILSTYLIYVPLETGKFLALCFAYVPEKVNLPKEIKPYLHECEQLPDL